jgi:hypothetical protein
VPRARRQRIDFEPHTVANYANVCRAFSTTSRRRDVLSFGHHEAVAALPAREADKLLDQAERERLSRHALRLLVDDRQAELLADQQADAPAGDGGPENPADEAAEPPPLDEDDEATPSDQPDDGSEQVRARYHKGVNALAEVIKPSMRDVLVDDTTVDVSVLRVVRDMLNGVIGRRGGDVNGAAILTPAFLDIVGIEYLLDVMSPAMRAKLLARAELEAETKRLRERPAIRIIPDDADPFFKQ